MDLRTLGSRVLTLAALSAAPLLQACGGGGGAVVTARSPAYAVEVRDEQEVKGIPPGHMPPPGACRVWFPGAPPGQQPPPGACDELLRSVPGDAWLLHRPNEARRVYRIA